MIISVISPYGANNGNTLASVLLGMGLSDLKRKVLLTHVKPNSDSFKQYMGLESIADKTTTPTQLVKLTKEGAIEPSELGDYCKYVNDYMDAFTTTDKKMGVEDMDHLLEFILTKELTYEYVIVDIDDSIDSMSTQAVLNHSDIVILNTSPSVVELNKLKENKDDLMKTFLGKKLILLCSMYNQKALKVKDIPKKLGIKTTSLTVRFNPYYQWATNNGKMVKLFDLSKNRDVRVVEVYKDAQALVSSVTKAKIAINNARRRGVDKK